MTRLHPAAVLALFAFVGVLIGKFGLFLPLGIVAAILVGVAQSRRTRE